MAESKRAFSYYRGETATIEQLENPFTFIKQHLQFTQTHPNSKATINKSVKIEIKIIHPIEREHGTTNR